jgi:hypothetical protein
MLPGKSIKFILELKNYSHSNEKIVETLFSTIFTSQEMGKRSAITVGHGVGVNIYLCIRENSD